MPVCHGDEVCLCLSSMPFGEDELEIRNWLEIARKK